MSLQRTPLRINTSNVAFKQFLMSGDDIPADVDLINYVVVVPAYISGLDGPSYGYIMSQTSIPGTISKTGASPRQLIAFEVGELIGGVSNGNTTIVRKNELVFANEDHFELDADTSLYSFGRTINGSLVICVQVTDFRIDTTDPSKPKLFLTLSCRNSFPIVAPWEVKASAFVETNFNEFALGFGHNCDKAKFNKLNKWGVHFNAEVGKAPSLDLLYATSATPRFDFSKETLVYFLDGDDDQCESILHDHIAKNILLSVLSSTIVPSPSANSPAVAPSMNGKFAAASISNNATPAVSKKLSFAPADDASVADSIEHFDGMQGASSAPQMSSAPFVKSGSGFHMNAIQVANHTALFDPTIYSGTFISLPMESRAEFLLSKESMTAQYHVNRSAIMTIMDGSFGIKALSSFNATSIVPMDKKEFVDTNKWNVSTQPTAWIESMPTLAKTVKNIVGIIQRYYRPDIARALNQVYEHAYYWADTQFPQHGVNAYRDFYRGVIASTLMAATQGLRCEALTALTCSELAPSSSVYNLTITARQLRLNSGSAWGNVSQNSGNQQKLNPDSSKKNKKNNNGNATVRDMTDAIAASIPKGADGTPMCLAFQSAKGCNRPSCTFSHDALAIPAILQPLIIARHGALK